MSAANFEHRTILGIVVGSLSSINGVLALRGDGGWSVHGAVTGERQNARISNQGKYHRL